MTNYYFLFSLFFKEWGLGEKNIKIIIFINSLFIDILTKALQITIRNC